MLSKYLRQNFRKNQSPHFLFQLTQEVSRNGFIEPSLFLSTISYWPGHQKYAKFQKYLPTKPRELRRQQWKYFVLAQLSEWAKFLMNFEEYMMEIDGDNTFYSNRGTFWVYAGTHLYIVKCSVSSNFKFAWRLKHVFAFLRCMPACQTCD